MPIEQFFVVVFYQILQTLEILIKTYVQILVSAVSFWYSNFRNLHLACLTLSI